MLCSSASRAGLLVGALLASGCFFEDWFGPDMREPDAGPETPVWVAAPSSGGAYGSASDLEGVTIGLADSSEVPPLPSGWRAIGPILAFEPHGRTFSEPVLVSLPVDDTTATVRFALTAELGASGWTMLPDEGSAPNVTVHVTHFSHFVAATMEGAEPREPCSVSSLPPSVYCAYPGRSSPQSFTTCCAALGPSTDVWPTGVGVFAIQFDGACGSFPRLEADPSQPADFADCRPSGMLYCNWPGGSVSCPALYTTNASDGSRVYVSGCCGPLTSAEHAPSCGVIAGSPGDYGCLAPDSTFEPVDAGADACGGTCSGDTPVCNGGTCVCSDFSCASGSTCSSGRCVPECGRAGAGCDFIRTCCSPHSCVGGACCTMRNGECARDSDCCDGRCRRDPVSGYMTCQPACFADGETVSWDGYSTLCAECCSGRCVASSDPRALWYTCGVPF